MFSLSSLLGSLTYIMALAVINGGAGFLCAIGVTVFGALGVAKLLGESIALTYTAIGLLAVGCGVLRGILRYFEQYSNHFIAFKLLAVLRDKVFKALRRLAPAKLESKQKGGIISMLTADIETLEVFYAHTLSPIMIAVLTGAAVFIFVGLFASWSLALTASAGYIAIGAVVPVISNRVLRRGGEEYREGLSSFNSYFLDGIKGVKEIVLYNAGAARAKEIGARSDGLLALMKRQNARANTSGALTQVLVALFIAAAVAVGGAAVFSDGLSVGRMIVGLAAVVSSFGPFIALSALPANLSQTFASGDRVLNLLDEKPAVEPITDGKTIEFERLEVKNLKFGYGNAANETSEISNAKFNDKTTNEISNEKSNANEANKISEISNAKLSADEAANETTNSKSSGKTANETSEVSNAKSSVGGAEVLKGVSLTVKKGEIVGLVGASGCGKSTLLKLLLRFWKKDGGEILYNGVDIDEIDADSLLKNASMVSQTTYLFDETLEYNLKIAAPNASENDVIEACKKASIHDFISALPDGYKTRVGTLGDKLSAGEKQRVGLARAFLRNSPLIFLDEPTSNVDGINEGIILNALNAQKGEKAIILVSHRESTVAIADRIYRMSDGTAKEAA
jgi:ABC-type multidrug transport system fused ATPase/permease subunit